MNETDKPKSMLAVSETDITQLGQLLPTLPDHIQTMADAVATLLVARELGLAPMSSFSDLMIINGTVGFTSKLMLALVFKAGHRIDVETSTTEATSTCYRRFDGEWVQTGKFTFTQEDAERANLWAKETYQSYPADMLANKSIARAVRFAFSDVLLGYCPDEMEDIAGVEVPLASHLDPTGQPMELDEIVEVFNAEIVEDEDE